MHDLFDDILTKKSMYRLVVLLGVSLFVKCDGNERSKRGILYDETCLPTNCSQPARKYPGDNKFICGIGHQKECELTNTNRYGPKSENPNIARLCNVHLYGRTHVDYEHGEYRSLNLSILLPNADQQALKTKMIRLNFYSPYGPHMDEFYHKHSRCRLFYYHNSKLTKVDLEHPRKIPYPCLVGLSESSVRHSYVVNLTVYPYEVSTAYHLVTYSYIGGERCISASAIALLSPTQRIHVVFDAVQGINQLLFLKDNEVLETVNITSGNQFEFPVQGFGVYKVGIEHQTKICGMIFTDDITIPETTTSGPSIVLILYGVISTIVVVIVVITVLIFKKRELLSYSVIRKLVPTCFFNIFDSTNDIENLLKNIDDDDESLSGEETLDEEPIDLESQIIRVPYTD